MKNHATRQVRVGFFVALGLGLFMLIVFLLGDLRGFFRKYYDLNARFEEISGLRQGSPIFLAGINIGEVESIQFPQKLDEKRVVVKMKVQSHFQDRIREDSTASITTQGLLGDKAVFVTVGTPAKKPIPDGGEIAAAESVSIAQFTEKGGEILQNLNELAANLNRTITDIRTKESFINALIYDPAGKDIIARIGSMVKSVDEITQAVQKGNGVMHAMLYDPVTEGFGKEMGGAMKNLNAASASLKNIGMKIEKGEGSLGALINDPTVYHDLMTLLGNANRNKLLRTVIRATLATNEQDLTGSSSNSDKAISSTSKDKK